MTSPPRVRFAPSPTGSLHVGGARTALFNWAFARRHGGVFVLRIEDTDRERSTPEHERAILEGLAWLGLDWDEGPDVGGEFGPYRQTERYEGYRPVAEELIRSGAAYRSFQGAEEIEAAKEEARARGGRAAFRGSDRDLPLEESERRAAAGEPFTIRFKVPEGRTELVDMIRGDVAFPNDEVDDWVMVRTDGAPTYNFVCVCDDRDMRITHVMRGEEHLVNTPKQVLLCQALGLEPPVFAHFPLMLGTDGKKLSKRTGDTALSDYRDKGYPPEAVCNFLCLQGWALDDRTDVFPLATFVERFDPADVGKAGAVFDPDKFLWMAGEYLHAEPLERLAERALPFVLEAGLVSEGELDRDWFVAAVATARERIRLYSELPDQLAYLFAPDDAVPYDPKAEKNARKRDLGVLEAYRAWLADELAADADAERLREGTKAFLSERGAELPVLFQPLRCVLTGRAGGPDVADVILLLGADRALARIDAGLARLREAHASA